MPAEGEVRANLVGIDVIGDYLTELNVTSPTELQEINRLDGVTLERKVWDAIEARTEDYKTRVQTPRRRSQHAGRCPRSAVARSTPIAP